MTPHIPKLVDGNHYLLWTDALHARQLARQANSKWDRAAYVRWSILLTWTVIEIACQDSMEEPRISYSFRQNLDKRIAEKNLPPLDWQRGVWHKVSQLQNLRKDIAHRFSNQSHLFPDHSIAEFALSVSRDAIKDIYNHAGKQEPPWIDDDADPGWTGESTQSHVGMANLTKVTKDASNEDDPVKVCYFVNDEEKISDIIGLNDDPKPFIDELLQNARVPISRVRVIRGETVLFEQNYNIRGT